MSPRTANLLGVRGITEYADQGGRGRHGDQTAGPPLNHGGGDGPDRVQNAEVVEFDLAAEHVVPELSEIAGLRGSRRRHQDVAGPGLLNEASHHLVELGAIGYVGHRASDVTRHRRGRLPKLAEIAGDERDLIAARGQQGSDRPAKPPRSAGDDGVTLS
jgi:hypothetical protein